MKPRVMLLYLELSSFSTPWQLINVTSWTYSWWICSWRVVYVIPNFSFPQLVNSSFFFTTPLCYILLSNIYHMELLFIRMFSLSSVVWNSLEVRNSTWFSLLLPVPCRISETKGVHNKTFETELREGIWFCAL